MNKAIFFDMDGTIADLYGVDGWLDDLRAERVRPYAEAKPLVNLSLNFHESPAELRLPLTLPLSVSHVPLYA